MKLKLLVVIGLLLLSTLAMADTFILTATGPTTTMNATLTGSLLAPGVYNITGMTGNVNGIPISSLLATDQPGQAKSSAALGGWYITYDNLLNMNPGQTFVNENGFGFMLDSNTVLSELYFQNGYLYFRTNSTFFGSDPNSQLFTNVSVAQTPEPASLLLLGSGLLTGVGVLRRRSKA